MAESKPKTPLDELLQEDLSRKNADEIKILKNELFKAKKRLNLQKMQIDAMARKIQRLEVQQ